MSPERRGPSIPDRIKARLRIFNVFGASSPGPDLIGQLPDHERLKLIPGTKAHADVANDPDFVKKPWPEKGKK